MEIPAKFEPHRSYFYPTEDVWLKLDNNTGQELFYLLASPDPINDIDMKIDQLKKSGIDNIEKIFQGVKLQSFGFKHD